MTENERINYLEVPKTRSGQRHFRPRAKSNEQLLPGSDAQADQTRYTPGPPPNRFPSIHAPAITDIPPIPPLRVLRPDANQYAPISPIDEEEEDITDAASQGSLQDPLGSDFDKPFSPIGPVRDFWTPVWLRRPVLALFAILFTALLIAILVLWVVSQNRNGFHVDNPVGHQGWAYVPTILMVIIVALWRQVDYHCKSLFPWDELQNGPIAPSKSLLLDYVSPFQLSSLFEALLHGHIPIIATIVSFILLKVITIFSTGVFIQLPTTVTMSNFPLITVADFNISFNQNTDINASNFSAAAVYSYYGYLTQHLPLQPGVTPSLAYAPTILDTKAGSKLSGDISISSETDAFLPLINCHQMNVELVSPNVISQSDTNNAYGLGNLSVTLPAGDICNNWSSISIPTLNPQTQMTPARQISGILQTVYCASNANDRNTVSRAPAGLLYTVTDISYEQELFSNASDISNGLSTIASNSSRTVQAMINVICVPSYAITRVNIRNDTSTSGPSSEAVRVSSISNAQNRTIEDLSNWNITSIFTTLVSASDGLFGGADTGDNIERASRSFFKLMALYHGNENLTVLLDPESLVNAATATFKGVVAQYAHQSLTSPRNESIDGTVTYTESRYHVNDISAFLMVAGFAVAAVSSILLLFKGPRAVTPQNPNYLTFHATVLARSYELNRLLQQEDVPSSNNHESTLHGFEVGTAMATSESGRQSFKIVITEGVQEGVELKRDTELRWFRPITATIPFFIVIMLVPVGLIIGLEFLQRSSNRNQGILAVPDTKRTDLYTHYIPALVMIIVASLVNLVDFNIALFTPWSKLSKGNATHRNGVISHLLGKSPPTAFVEAIRTKNFAAILSIIAAMLASVLPIISAALYTTELRPSAGSEVQLIQLETFNLSWPDSFVSDNGAAGITDRILQEKLSYPDFTFRELVFPTFSADSLSDYQIDTTTGTTSVKLPALRASLRCDIIADVAVNVTTVRANETEYGLNLAFVNVQADLPSTCRLGGPEGNGSSFAYNLAVPLPENRSRIYGGAQIDLLFGNGSSTYGNAGENNGQLIDDNPPVGCPSLAFVYGRFQLGSDGANQVTTMVCYQQIERLDANVTLFSNTTTIDRAHPPTADESTAVLQANSLSDIESTSFDFRIQQNIAREMSDLSLSTNAPTVFDHFFDAALFNFSGPQIEPASLIGSENHQVFFETVQHFYRIYVAQAISANMRQNLTSTPSSTAKLFRRQSSPSTPNSNDNILATTNTTRLETRLIQHNSHKLTLQVLLGLIALLTLKAYLLSRTRDILPCNPASIAGTMSLLAGSDLCHSEDDGLCECCGKPRRRSIDSFHTAPNTPTPPIHYASGGLPPHAPRRPSPLGLAINRIPDDDNTHIIATDPDELDTRPHPHSSNLRRQLIPDGIEWYTAEHFKLAFAGRRYAMGWWRAQPSHDKKRRFGVDIGARADGDDDKDWELGEKVNKRSMDDGFTVLSGRKVRRDWIGGNAGTGSDGRGAYARPGAAENGLVVGGGPGHMRNISYGEEGSPAPIRRKPVAGRGLREA